MGVDAIVIAGIGIELTELDTKLLIEHNPELDRNYAFPFNEYNNGEFNRAGVNIVKNVFDFYEGEFSYLLFVTHEEYVFSDALGPQSFDLDQLTSYKQEIIKKYKEATGTDLDETRIKFVSMVTYS